MTVYVDTMEAQFGRMIMCHMVAVNLDELHAMAEKIGVARRHFQDKKRHPHYDICKSKRTLAVRAGAQEIDQKCSPSVSLAAGLFRGVEGRFSDFIFRNKQAIFEIGGWQPLKSTRQSLCHPLGTVYRKPAGSWYIKICPVSEIEPDGQEFLTPAHFIPKLKGGGV
jgi:hypothetical protein